LLKNHNGGHYDLEKNYKNFRKNIREDHRETFSFLDFWGRVPWPSGH
jgi:hypothetical protein